MSEWQQLLPSPTYAARMPAGSPKRSRIVMMSARPWHGWCAWVSALITGTSACSASSITLPWSTVRMTMASTNRDNTFAVSSIVSPRPSCMSRPASTTGWPPSRAMPTSNDTRVRVDGCSKMRATLLPASGVGHSGDALS